MNTSFPPIIPTVPSGHPLVRSAATLMTAAAAAAVMVMAGCASTGAPAQSGLARYDQLQVQPDGVRSFRAPTAGEYRHARIDPADVVVAAGIELTREQSAEVRGTLVSALAQSFARAGLRNDTDGPRLRLRLRATVTGVEKANPAVNAITTVLLLAPVTRGGLTVELEALDAATGERIAAMAYEGKAGLKDVGRAYSSLGHASAEADRAAQRFAELIVPNARPEGAAVQPMKLAEH